MSGKGQLRKRENSYSLIDASERVVVKRPETTKDLGIVPRPFAFFRPKISESPATRRALSQR